MEEPVAKRPRLDVDATAADGLQQQQQLPQQGPTIQSLFQVTAGLPREPSPGAMHGCRIAAWSLAACDLQYGCVLASGPRVYWSHLALKQHMTPEQGKEGILLPLRLQAPAAVQIMQLRHAGEVQALAITQAPQQQQQQQQPLLLATVDAFGLGSLSRLTVSEVSAALGAEADAAAAAAAAPAVAVQAKLKPQDSCREGGWAGVCFSSSSSSSSSSNDSSLRIATARGFAKDVTLYDAEACSVVRTFYCGLNPYALKFLPPGIGGDGSSLLAVAESHMISLWDARVSGAAGGCVQRMATATQGQPLFALDWCAAQGGLLGSAGAERSVFLTEPRKWRQLSKWGGATRLAIHSLSFLEQDPRYAVLAGLDMEVLCGRWDKPSSNMRAFQSTVPGEDAAEQPAAAAAAAAAARPAAVGAPGSGDRSRGAVAAVPAAAGAAAGVGGSDADVAGGFSFRGDARWLGVSKAAGVDTLAGFAASGNLVYARVC